MRKKQMNIQTLAPDKFPRRLREIPDPPEELYMQGTLPSEEHKWLAVVGARKYTEYGREAVEMLIAGLRGFPVVIVSGLALGIDALAHRAALSAGLPAVAIPGSGLNRDVLYPASNAALAEEIVAKGGALLSEFAPDFRATKWSFPQRNRIMAGLSDAVLIVEAEVKSGTLITARLATEYNRDVFTVPGGIFSRTSDGPRLLIRLGATPIGTSAELLDALGLKAILPTQSPEEKYRDCSEEELVVVKLLTEPLSRDELVVALNLPVSRANALLSVMEIKGLITESVGEIRLI
ncbi:MAG: Uncharacterized protein G01um101472_490 [Parcubacteria group bacterium Gr01-1014_72]|nr:MAG: Uncharacterized protein G01um101472_490 [Parcubacteria group bacterium Gr01-1014_72]